MSNGWSRLNQYAIRKAPWIIAKAFVDGATLYVLSGDDGVRYGHFESADEAKSHAAALDLGARK